MSDENPLTRSDFVHAESVERVPPGYDLLTFPDGFHCYTHTSTDETELIYNEIVVKKEYLPPGLSLQDARCVIDVGANIGVFTLFAKLCSPRAAVYSIEAIPETFDVLQANIGLHHLENVHAFQAAAGLQDHAVRRFTFYPNMAGNSTANPDLKQHEYAFMTKILGRERTDWFFEKRERTAEVRTLSSIIKSSGITEIDYLKIDVEGDELDVLAGISPGQYGMIRQIAVEVHTPDRAERTRERLSQMGLKALTGKGISEGSGVVTVYAVR